MPRPNRRQRRQAAAAARTAAPPLQRQLLDQQADSRRSITQALLGWAKLSRAGAPGTVPFITPVQPVHGLNRDGAPVTVVARLAVFPGHLPPEDAIDLEGQAELPPATPERAVAFEPPASLAAAIETGHERYLRAAATAAAYRGALRAIASTGFGGFVIGGEISSLEDLVANPPAIAPVELARLFEQLARFPVMAADALDGHDATTTQGAIELMVAGARLEAKAVAGTWGPDVEDPDVVHLVVEDGPDVDSSCSLTGGTGCVWHLERGGMSAEAWAAVVDGLLS